MGKEYWIQMKINENRKKKYHFLILVPHKEVQRQIEEYRQGLFSKGFKGAHSFPLCAPLAGISRLFSLVELKELAMNIREQSMESDGKILSGENVLANCPAFTFFGPGLNLNIKKTNKLLYTLSPPLLCAALVKEGIEYKAEKAKDMSFRAASVANLTISPLDETGFSYKWEISRPVWLPAYK